MRKLANNTIGNNGMPVVRQRGVVLLLALIMLLLMTVVGLAAIRGTGLQETMAGNMRERTIAFQHAEAGLRVGEDWIEDTPISNMNFDGGNGLYRDLGLPENNMFNNGVREWTGQQWGERSTSSGLALVGDGEFPAPRYVIEEQTIPPLLCAEDDGSAIDLGSLPEGPCIYYRVTARGVSASGNSDALVQSSFRKE